MTATTRQPDAGRLPTRSESVSALKAFSGIRPPQTSQRGSTAAPGVATGGPGPNRRHVLTAGAAQLEAIRKGVFEIEPPIGEMHLCWAALHKLADQLDDGWLQTAMFAVLEDLDLANVSTKRIFTELFKNVGAVSSCSASPDSATKRGQS